MEDNKKVPEISAEEIKQKHGDKKVYEVSFDIQPDGENDVSRKYFFVKPKVSSYDRYVKSMSQSVTKAMKTFVLDNIVPEQLEQLTADLEEYPAMALGLGEKLLTMLGLAKEVNLVKL